MNNNGLIIDKYTPTLKDEWDHVVDSSRNGTFMLKRDYMDYHADRFEDMSLIIRDHKGRVLALMAAAVPYASDKDLITAHPGLTYGGLIVPYPTTSLEIGEAVDAVMDY